MIKFATFNTLLLTNWLLSISQFHFVFGVKPHCVGPALKPDEFSKEKDVGFVRDIIVDKIARNLNNKLRYKESESCKKLANLRTSTCWCKCYKWKRSNPKNDEVVSEVMNKAEELLENFIHVISKEASLRRDDEYVIAECVNDAISQLINSKVVTEDSKIISLLEHVKNIFCTHHQLLEHQKQYQTKIGAADVETMTKLGHIIDNEDVVLAVKHFLRAFKLTYCVRILNFHIEDNVTKTASGLFRLKYEWNKKEAIMMSKVILKIPSLAPYYENMKKLEAYNREAHIYRTILPTLHELGLCLSKPFAPILIAATKNAALVLEDLTVSRYESWDKSLFLDFAHIQISLQVLAKYHAFSYAYLCKLDPDDPSMALIGTRKINTPSDQFDTLCNVIQASLDSSLFDKIIKAKDEILNKLPMVNPNNENSMTVITHGDFNKKNIFFKYDVNGEVSQVKLIDWQSSTVRSPVIELMEFFVENISIEIFKANEDALLNSYVNTFNENLSSLSTNRVYSRSELEEDTAFYKYHYFRALSALASNYVERDLMKKLESCKSQLIEWVLYLQKKNFI